MSHIKLRNRDQWIRTQLEKLLISDHLLVLNMTGVHCARQSEFCTLPDQTIDKPCSNHVTRTMAVQVFSSCVKK